MRSVSKNPLVVALSAVVLTSLFAVAGYYITRPYVQYEEGQFYKTGNTAIASLRLENKGYFDAEEVIISAAFVTPITDVTTDDPSIQLTITNGGKGTKTIVARLARIVPSQSIYVYFAVDNSDGSVGATTPAFIRQITYKGGQGTTAPPIWISLFTNLVAAAGGVLVALALNYYFHRIARLETKVQDQTRRLNAFHELERTQVDYMSAFLEDNKQFQQDMDDIGYGPDEEKTRRREEREATYKKRREDLQNTYYQKMAALQEEINRES